MGQIGPRGLEPRLRRFKSLLPYQFGYISSIDEYLHRNSDSSILTTIWFYILELLIAARFKGRGGTHGRPLDRRRFSKTNTINHSAIRPKGGASHWQRWDADVNRHI